MSGRSYPSEFKRDAVALTERDGVAAVSRSLGINENMLYRWRKESKEQGKEAFRGKGVMTREQAELAALRRENASLKEDNIILKKALTIFSQKK
jgi:transposase